jgi:hypothetical protein
MRRFEVDHELELRRRLHWQGGRPLALENAIDIGGRTSDNIGGVGSIRHQRAFRDEANDRIVHDERRSGRAHKTRKDADNNAAIESVNNAYLVAKNPWLQRQFHAPLGLGDLPFVVGGRPVAGEVLPPLQPNLKLDDTIPFRLSRNHFMIEKRDGSYYVRDLCSTLGTIVNGEPIGEHFRGDDAPLRAGENEVIAGGVDSPFVFSLFIA